MTLPASAGTATSGASGDAGAEAFRVRTEGRGLFHSSLTRRVLAVNLIAPVLLAAGFLYFDAYKRALYESVFQRLETEATLVAAAVAVSAVDPDHSVRLDRDRARSMLCGLVANADIRARLFDADGAMLIDSRPPPPPEPELRKESESSARRLFEALIPSRRDGRGLPLELDLVSPTAGDYVEVQEALRDGPPVRQLRVSLDQELIFSTAVPVQRKDATYGAVMVTRPGDDIVAALLEMRMAIVQVFVLTLMVTLTLSLYLAGTIARPLVRLAGAADRVRKSGSGRNHQIPDYSSRSDELGDLSGALRAMTDALWARMDAIAGFAADVAHELKNPLTSLRSAVETAMRMKDPEKQKRLMEIVLHDVERLDRLITDISNASRLDAELSRAESEPTELRPLLEALIQFHAPEAEKRRVALRLNLEDPDDLLEVMASEGRLTQVFRNLIVNALSFSPEGASVSVDAMRDYDRAVVTVSDEGPGIPPGAFERIFERFYSERPEGEKFGQHSGLGLAISRQIVETYGGSIVAANIKDEKARTLGARFTVVLSAVVEPNMDDD